MTKITRPTGNLKAFASNPTGTERSIFGEYPTQSDDITNNITAEFLRGWGSTPVNTPPIREDFNALGFTSTQLIAYLFQMGCAEWDIAQEYELGSASITSGNIYISKSNSNIGNSPLTDTVNWKRLAALEEVVYANLINYDNSTSGLASTKVQGAIDLLSTAANIKYNNSISHLVATKVQDAIDELISKTVIPVGAVQYFAMNAVPSGWLVCDGSAVSRTVNYGNLYDAIGSIYGDGDGLTTFNLPDLRGQFIRGFDSSGTIDPARVFGTSQLDAMQRHSHYTGVGTRIQGPANDHDGRKAYCGAGSTNNNLNIPRSTPDYFTAIPDFDGITSDIISSGVSMTSAGTGSNATTSCKASSTETRPKNITMNACIKY